MRSNKESESLIRRVKTWGFALVYVLVLCLPVSAFPDPADKQSLSMENSKKARKDSTTSDFDKAEYLTQLKNYENDFQIAFRKQWHPSMRMRMFSKHHD